MFVCAHPTSGASVHPKNAVVYSAGNGGCWVFSEIRTTALPALYSYSTFAICSLRSCTVVYIAIQLSL